MQETANIGKWYTFVEYYNEDGIQISKKEAIKNYLVLNTRKVIKINGNTGTRTFIKECGKNKQLKLF